MVRLLPIRTATSASEDRVACLGSPTNKVPNRFRSKHYDRSVFGIDDCVKAWQPCNCQQCSESPLVIVAAGQKICDTYNITSRNVIEYVDGGLLEPIHENAFIVYAQKSAPGEYQVGVLAALHVDDYRNNTVRRHELCVPQSDAAKPRRVKLFESLYVDPIMVMHRHESSVAALLSKAMESEEPLSLDWASSSDDPDSHRLWRVRDPELVQALQQAFLSVKTLYIADGHHRTAAACSSSRLNMRSSSQYITALLFADTQLNVLSYNRCLRSLENHSVASFMEAVKLQFLVLPCTLDEANQQRGACQHDQDDLYLFAESNWYRLRLLEEQKARCKRSAVLGNIHAQILVEHILQPVLGLCYPKSEESIIYVDGREGRKAVEACVLSGQAVVGFALKRVSTKEVMQIADAGELLPPKATFFDPKPLPGLLLRLQR